LSQAMSFRIVSTATSGPGCLPGRYAVSVGENHMSGPGETIFGKLRERIEATRPWHKRLEFALRDQGVSVRARVEDHFDSHDCPVSREVFFETPDGGSEYPTVVEIPLTFGEREVAVSTYLFDEEGKVCGGRPDGMFPEGDLRLIASAVAAGMATDPACPRRTETSEAPSPR
jgi:hypothetical protein